jgi:tetratricopeptide (TPR) repeat protein
MKAFASPPSTTDPDSRPELRPQRSTRGVRRVGLGLIIAALTLCPAVWFMTRFDRFGHAAAAYEKHQYRVALRAANDYMRWFPDDRGASLMAARCLARLNRARDAEPYYRKAAPLALADAHARAYAFVGINEPKRAALAYDELLGCWPDDALALKRLAAVRMGMEQWREVLKLADRLIAIPPEEVAGQTMAGIAHHELKHYEQAVAAGLRVLELDNNLERMPLPRKLFWNNLALDLMAGGRTDEARGYLTRALADSHDAGLLELLGLTHSQQGSIDEAERCWRQAESWDPDNADVCLDLGRLAVSRRQWSEAVTFLKRAAARSSHAVEPLYSLSQAYRMLGNVDEAERYRRLADQRRQAHPAVATGMGTSSAAEPRQETDEAGARGLPR